MVTQKQKDKILDKLNRAQRIINDAFALLKSAEDIDKCNKFSGLTCDLDEAIAEVEGLGE